MGFTENPISRGAGGHETQICDLLQEKGPSTFAFLTAFRCFQLSLTAFQKFDTNNLTKTRLNAF